MQPLLQQDSRQHRTDGFLVWVPTREEKSSSQRSAHPQRSGEPRSYLHSSQNTGKSTVQRSETWGAGACGLGILTQHNTPVQEAAG